jgi:hypothetical protein
MKFDINKVSIGFIVIIALITLFVYGHENIASCSQGEENCVCQEKVILDTSMIEGRLSITPYTRKYCKKVIK